MPMEILRFTRWHTPPEKLLQLLTLLCFMYVEAYRSYSPSYKDIFSEQISYVTSSLNWEVKLHQLLINSIAHALDHNLHLRFFANSICPRKIGPKLLATMVSIQGNNGTRTEGIFPWPDHKHLLDSHKLNTVATVEQQDKNVTLHQWLVTDWIETGLQLENCWWSRTAIAQAETQAGTKYYQLGCSQNLLYSLNNVAYIILNHHTRFLKQAPDSCIKLPPKFLLSQPILSMLEPMIPVHRIVGVVTSE